VNRPRLLDLKHGHQTAIDQDDWPLVCDLTFYVGVNGYVYYSTWEQGKSIPRTLHGLLMQAPPGTHVDHVNGDKLDNRRCNLRVVSPQRNQVNRKRLNRNNTSGVRGVSRRSHLSATRPWLAQITVNRKNVYLGVFATQEDAVAARRAAELEYFGELCP
jgi:hypothetical protein